MFLTKINYRRSDVGKHSWVAPDRCGLLRTPEWQVFRGMGDRISGAVRSLGQSRLDADRLACPLSTLDGVVTDSVLDENSVLLWRWSI